VEIAGGHDPLGRKHECSVQISWEQVLEANLELVRRGLVLYTFGNASGISRERNLVVIKPSGVPYDRMRPKDLVVTDLQGRIVERTFDADRKCLEIIRLVDFDGAARRCDPDDHWFNTPPAALRIPSVARVHTASATFSREAGSTSRAKMPAE